MAGTSGLEDSIAGTREKVSGQSVGLVVGTGRIQVGAKVVGRPRLLSAAYILGAASCVASNCQRCCAPGKEDPQVNEKGALIGRETPPRSTMARERNVTKSLVTRK